MKVTSGSFKIRTRFNSCQNFGILAYGISAYKFWQILWLNLFCSDGTLLNIIDPMGLWLWYPFKLKMQKGLIIFTQIWVQVNPLDFGQFQNQPNSPKNRSKSKLKPKNLF